MFFEIYRAFRKILNNHKKDLKILKSNLYYKDINEIPMYNWWKANNGELQYLYKELDNYIPSFFQSILEQMYFQLEYIDLSELRKIVKSNYYENKYKETDDIKWQRKAATIKAEAELLAKSNQGDVKLFDLVRSVQIALNLNWPLDPLKISAGYFFNLYNEAKTA